MNAKRYVTPSALRRAVLLAASLALALAFAVWLANGPTAEGRPTDGLPTDFFELTAPVGFAVSASQDNSETAFREDEAGFSAYHRFTDAQGDPIALNVYGITDKLLKKPDESNSIRASKQGKYVDVGLNFGIVTLPMVAVVGVSGPIQDVTVYYDDQGWIAAYLACEPPADEQAEPTCEPAAAIWKHDTTDGKTTEQELGNNLLVLAINEVIRAHNQDLAVGDPSRLPEVSHDGDDNGDNKVKYSDWQNPDCDAFVLFSVRSDGGASDTVNFVIPHTIKTKDIAASAAALITTQQAKGADAIATTMVDDAMLAFALADEMLHVAHFTLIREDGKTSLHRMSVAVGEGESAAGAVMLLYKRP